MSGIGNSNRLATPRAHRTVSDDQTRLAIVEHLIAGKTILETAEAVGYHRTQVQMVAGFQGWPDLQRMEWNRAALADRIAGLGLASVEVAPVKRATPKPRKKAEPKPRRVRDECGTGDESRHVLVQHRDGRAPWCDDCGRDAAGIDVEDMPSAFDKPAILNPRPSSLGSLTDLVERGRASRRVRNRQRAERLVVLAAQLRNELQMEAEGR